MKKYRLCNKMRFSNREKTYMMNAKRKKEIDICIFVQISLC